MSNFYIRFTKLLWGLLLYALGIILTIKGNIGYAPWEVFHVGLSKTFNVTIGEASIVIGIIIGIAVILFGEKLGIGTILNMFLIGVFLDLILKLDIIPVANNIIVGIGMVVLGLFVIALASYYYIGSGFGAGPRDSLMVALTRKTKLPVGICRGSIEVIVVFVGWKLGGMVGLGTVLSAFLIGFCVQTIFKILKFNPTEIEHETVFSTYKSFLKISDIQK